jgi:dihydropyrimidinase
VGVVRTLIAGGTVVTAEASAPLDVLVDGERIAEVAPAGHGWTADRVIDAAGRYVIPGGIDAHTHMELPFGAAVSRDTFETGTAAAVWGGTTTIIDFTVQTKGVALRDGVDAWLAKAEGHCAIDYGFHAIVGDVTDQSLAEMDALVEEGFTSFKLFMAYPGVYQSDDGQILATMQRAAANGALVMMHAENGPAIDLLVAQALARGETSPVDHMLSRPPALEAEATRRAVDLARVGAAPLYVVYLSSAPALAAVAEARAEGANVFGETCPQYLYLSIEDQGRRPPEEAATFVCSPPLRSRAEGHQDALWDGLADDELSIVATDHCPFCRADKHLGLDDFTRIPNGLGSVEHRLDLLHQGVVEGRLTTERWVDICSTTPARMFGLHPRKGVIAPGSDADLVVYDPTVVHTLSAATHHMNTDLSAYEGLTVTGRAETVLSRGEVVLDRGRYRGRPGHGRFLRRDLCACLS